MPAAVTVRMCGSAIEKKTQHSEACLLLTLFPNRDCIQVLVKKRNGRHNLVASPHGGESCVTPRVVDGRMITDALDAGLADAFSLLTTGDQAQVRATLQLVAFTTLSTPAGAQLWASILEVATTPLDPGGSFSVDNFASALLNAVSTIAGAQFAASSFGP
jgi:hypothetical protein